MMFDYEWVLVVLDELAAVYVAATGEERDRMAAGVEAFNARLAADPFEVGESREENQRIAFIPLLQVLFEINKNARTVRVTAVARYGR